MAHVLVCGAINWDTICLVEHLPIQGEEVTCDSVGEVPGGTGANAAVAAARILGRDEVALFAALGKDSIATMQLGILDAEGVVHEPVLQIGGQSSGHAYIFVDHTGQNVIASNLGANAALNARHARQARLSTLLQTCSYVVLTDPPLPVALHLLQAATALGLPALWDPGILVRHGWNVLGPLTGNVDTLVLNGAEAAHLFGTDRLDEIGKVLASGPSPSFLVLKLGSRGSVLMESRSGMTVHVPALPVSKLGMTVVNTVGCGDVFLGAYAAYLALGSERRQALLMASAAGGLNATRPETRGGPDRTSLEDTVHRAASLGFELTQAEGGSG